MRETILNYVEGGSECYLAALDAAKAFDRLWRDGLFFKLINKIVKHIWLILKKYYSLSEGIINHENIFSKKFNINGGVKQGGDLSPFLFYLFIDELINECLELDTGACIGNINTSIIVYCDDVYLLSPSISIMQMLLDKCVYYGMNWKINFNSSKSKIIQFGNSSLKSKILYE